MPASSSSPQPCLRPRLALLTALLLVCSSWPPSSIAASRAAQKQPKSRAPAVKLVRPLRLETAVPPSAVPPAAAPRSRSPLLTTQAMLMPATAAALISRVDEDAAESNPYARETIAWKVNAPMPGEIKFGRWRATESKVLGVVGTFSLPALQ